MGSSYCLYAAVKFPTCSRGETSECDSRRLYWNKQSSKMYTETPLTVLCFRKLSTPNARTDNPVIRTSDRRGGWKDKREECSMRWGMEWERGEGDRARERLERNRNRKAGRQTDTEQWHLKQIKRFQKNPEIKPKIFLSSFSLLSPNSPPPPPPILLFILHLPLDFTHD